MGCEEIEDPSNLWIVELQLDGDCLKRKTKQPEGREMIKERYQHQPLTSTATWAYIPCAHTCMHTLHIHTHVQLHAHKHAYIVHTCMNTETHTHVHTHTQVHTQTHSILEICHTSKCTQLALLYCTLNSYESKLYATFFWITIRFGNRCEINKKAIRWVEQSDNLSW